MPRKSENRRSLPLTKVALPSHGIFQRILGGLGKAKKQFGQGIKDYSRSAKDIAANKAHAAKLLRETGGGLTPASPTARRAGEFSAGVGDAIGKHPYRAAAGLAGLAGAGAGASYGASRLMGGGDEAPKAEPGAKPKAEPKAVPAAIASKDAPESTIPANWLSDVSGKAKGVWGKMPEWSKYVAGGGGGALGALLLYNLLHRGDKDDEEKRSQDNVMWEKLSAQDDKLVNVILKKQASSIAQEAWIHFFDNVSNYMPWEKQGNVRLVQKALSEGKGINQAIGEAYPDMDPEERGIMRHKLIGKAAEAIKISNSFMSDPMVQTPQSHVGSVSSSVGKLQSMGNSPSSMSTSIKQGYWSGGVHYDHKTHKPTGKKKKQEKGGSYQTKQANLRRILLQMFPTLTGDKVGQANRLLQKALGRLTAARNQVPGGRAAYRPWHTPWRQPGPTQAHVAAEQPLRRLMQMGIKPGGKDLHAGTPRKHPPWTGISVYDHHNFREAYGKPLDFVRSGTGARGNTPFGASASYARDVPWITGGGVGGAPTWKSKLIDLLSTKIGSEKGGSDSAVSARLLKTLRKIAAQDNSAPQRSSVGGDNGLTFADAGPRVYGRDAWDLSQWGRSDSGLKDPYWKNAGFNRNQ